MNKKEDAPRTYQVEYYCLNCKNNFTKTFVFGVIATQGQCPKCGITPEDLKGMKW